MFHVLVKKEETLGVGFSYLCRSQGCFEPLFSCLGLSRRLRCAIRDLYAVTTISKVGASLLAGPLGRFAGVIEVRLVFFFCFH